MIGVFIPLARKADKTPFPPNHLRQIHDWLQEHVGYGQHIDQPSPVGCDYLFGYYEVKGRRGMRVSFKDARKATMFKLTWGGK